jgi:hypothetical protein
MDLQSLTPSFYASSIILLYFLFAIAWWFDSKIHHKLLKNQEHALELQTHRLILIPSILMELSLVIMYWYPWHALPFFLATYLTRTFQEGIDESKWHTVRCSLNESLLHLIMWISVHAKTILTFIWGFFFQFAGVNDLAPFYYFFFAIVLGLNSWIAWRELQLRP